MNAAARLVHQHALPRHLLLTHLLSRRQVTALTLILTVLLSALSIVYVTHATRLMYANYQRNLVEQSRLHVEHSQLLLEQSTWTTQARIQQIATSKLQMVTPNHDSIVFVRE